MNAKNGTPVLYTLSGGLSYGTSLPEGGDLDFTMVTVMPMVHYLGLEGDGQVDSVQEFGDRGGMKTDTTYHEVTKFFRMVAAGNPAVYPFLFQKDPNMVGGKLDRVWKEHVLDNSSLFLSKAPYHAFRGMALQERKRFEASLGTDKPAWKSAMHSLRLMRMLVEYLKTEQMTVCRVGVDQEELWSVRKGERYAAEVVAQVEALEAEAEKLVEASSLPTRCSTPALSSLLVDLKRATWQAQGATW